MNFKKSKRKRRKKNITRTRLAVFE